MESGAAQRGVARQRLAERPQSRTSRFECRFATSNAPDLSEKRGLACQNLHQDAASRWRWSAKRNAARSRRFPKANKKRSRPPLFFF